MDNYYMAQKPRLLRGFDRALKSGRAVLIKRYGDDPTAGILQDARLEFNALIPELPYIGGKKNMMTLFLIESAFCLALYKVLRRRDETVEEIAKIIYEIVEARLEAAPGFFLRLVGKLRYGRRYLRRLQKLAVISQQRQYPGDWVFTFVRGDGQDFDYGYDITECGICKFFQAHNADQLTPYVCLVDFPLSQAFGRGLVRTTTIAGGDERCDFRYKKGRETQPGWPPKFLDTKTA